MDQNNITIDAVLKWVHEKQEEISYRRQIPCIFGVGIPVAIAKVQHKMLCELIDIMLEANDQSVKENDHAN